jgi:type III secretory pathway component EscT
MIAQHPPVAPTSDSVPEGSTGSQTQEYDGSPRVNWSAVLAAGIITGVVIGLVFAWVFSQL